MQDDTDADDCGDLCDADCAQDGGVGLADFGVFARCFPTNDPLCDHTEPVGFGPKGFADFGTFGQLLGGVPGPSGTTVGTTACPQERNPRMGLRDDASESRGSAR